LRLANPSHDPTKPNLEGQMLNKTRLTPAIAAVIAAAPFSAGATDYGQFVENFLNSPGIAHQQFGFLSPLSSSATAADVVPRELASASERQFLAGGLKAEFVSRSVGYKADMITFWPDDIDYTHLIVCNEDGRSGVVTTAFGTHAGQNPSVQRVDVSTGAVETILSGMDRCDGLRTTQWGTVLATEETDDGAGYEILDPMATTGCWISDRGAPGVDADIRSSIGNGTADSCESEIKKRTALATQSWEGLEVLDNGVVIGGDELRAGNGPDGFDSDGGAVFRFVPETFYSCTGAPVRPGQLCRNLITDLSQSPLVAGQNYALTNACTGNDDVGQGCEYGEGKWVAVGAATARDDADDNGATGYCRPEDLHVDRTYGMFNGGEGILWCWNNTCGGGEGETLCVTESNAAVNANDQVFDNNFNQYLLADGGNEAQAWVTRFVEGDEEMNSHDNLDIQPYTRNVYVVEDTTFGDIWACLPDGADRDWRTDGCVRMLSIRDPEAEPSGFIFDGTGRTAFYHVQHGQTPAALADFDSNPVDGETDDLIKITGFRIRK
jgi:hypothetical protein